ncbi:MAG: putative ABC transporter permease [Lachnospiraceae bacterium]
MRLEHFFALCLVATVVSLMGFIVENLWIAITKGFVDNRNMMLPFLIGYGLAMMLIYFLFGTPDQMHILNIDISANSIRMNLFLYYLLMMFCVSLGEILLGTFVEKTCHVYWWDYTALPMHITRYTSLPTSAGFSFMITLFMNRLFHPLMQYFLELDYETLRNSAIVFAALLSTDFILNAAKMYRTKSLNTLWRIDTTKTFGYRLIHY